MGIEQFSDSDRVSKIHPLNAQYLLDIEPHRLYGDHGGNLLELVVERFASTVVDTLYGHGGLIGVGYHDATTDGERSFHNTFILDRDGKIQSFELQYGEAPLGIEWDLFYMLLNPVEMNNWYLQDLRRIEYERARFARSDIGIELPRNTGPTGLKQSISIVREKYLQSLK